MTTTLLVANNMFPLLIIGRAPILICRFLVSSSNLFHFLGASGGMGDCVLKTRSRLCEHRDRRVRIFEARAHAARTPVRQQ
jgi:hypothetical protein